MKLSEKELQELAGQLRRPDGDEGRKVGEMMNIVNGNMINKAIENLQLSDNDTVLEIGPGTGSHVKSILNSGTSIVYHGIDISDTMVAEAAKLNSGLQNTSFTVTDGKSIPFEKGLFDKVITTNTIYFWENPQGYANEIARVLKPGGLFSIGFIPSSTMQYLPFAKYGFTHYDIEAVSKLLTSAGMEIAGAVTHKEVVPTNSGEQVEREFVILTAKKL